MSMPTNATDTSGANLSGPEGGLFIMSQITCVADEANAINPICVRHGFGITGFAPPVNTRPTAFFTVIAFPALGVLREHLTRHSSDELQHCVIYNVRPFAPMTMQIAQRWAQAGINLRGSASPFRSSVDDASQFICLVQSITTSTQHRVSNVVISGVDEEAILKSVFRLGYFGLLTQDSWAFLYPSIPNDPEQCRLDFSAYP